MRERDAFSAVLAKVRGRLRDGVYAPGAALVIVEIAHELRVSPTPVREALARLCGEGLLEDRRGWGYGVWRADRESFSELYRLQELLAGFALTHRYEDDTVVMDRLLASASAVDAFELRRTTETVFSALIQQGCQGPGVGAHRTLQDRLAPCRLAEARVFGLQAGWDELQTVVDAYESRRSEAISGAMKRYTDRRLEAIDALIRTMSIRFPPPQSI